MKFRLFGKSKLRVSEIGLGCNRIGEPILTDGEWIRLLQTAVDLGVNILDTAEQYTGGRSEQLIGKALGNRDDIFIATKVTPQKREPGRPIFTIDSVTKAVEGSLQRLRRDHIDIYQTHGGPLPALLESEIVDAFASLKEQGKIRCAAFAVFDSECALHFMRNGVADGFQVTYNLLDRSHAVPILDHTDEYEVGLISRMPYHRGILTGKFRPGEKVQEGHRARLQGDRLPDEVTRAEALRPLESRPGGLAALAMQYVLAEKRLSTVIPGARSIEQVQANIVAAEAPPLSPEEESFIARVQESWKKP